MMGNNELHWGGRCIEGLRYTGRGSCHQGPFKKVIWKYTTVKKFLKICTYTQIQVAL